jgi:hypothetical protein
MSENRVKKRIIHGEVTFVPEIWDPIPDGMCDNIPFSIMTTEGFLAMLCGTSEGSRFSASHLFVAATGNGLLCTAQQMDHK